MKGEEQKNLKVQDKARQGRQHRKQNRQKSSRRGTECMASNKAGSQANKALNCMSFLAKLLLGFLLGQEQANWTGNISQERYIMQGRKTGKESMGTACMLVTWCLHAWSRLGQANSHGMLATWYLQGLLACMEQARTGHDHRFMQVGMEAIHVRPRKGRRPIRTVGNVVLACLSEEAPGCHRSSGRPSYRCSGRSGEQQGLQKGCGC
ncbi:hypothetical protein DFS34DRAFT_441741 [Phlyctochytrium arcticum]|nr:hypothetical protein DFS34DRAFT_441741 [Phlyctochytrium arcticum]